METSNSKRDFVGYEYKDVTVKRDLESVYIDGYTNFGWTLEDTSVPLQNIGSITLKMKRDRKMRNKAELVRLQRQFESCLSEIEKLELSKSLGASVVAYIIGIVGAALMAGAVFSYLAGMVPLMIILALPAFAGWTVPYFLYMKLQRKKTDEVTPLIDKKYDEIYEVCEKANGLLA